MHNPRRHSGGGEYKGSLIFETHDENDYRQLINRLPQKLTYQPIDRSIDRGNRSVYAQSHNSLLSMRSLPVVTIESHCWCADAVIGDDRSRSDGTGCDNKFWRKNLFWSKRALFKQFLIYSIKYIYKIMYQCVECNSSQLWQLEALQFRYEQCTNNSIENLCVNHFAIKHTEVRINRWPLHDSRQACLAWDTQI